MKIENGVLLKVEESDIKDGSFIIPREVNEIAKNAFQGLNSLTSISIPNYVKKIGEGAFISCSELKEVDIPRSITEIPKKAFKGCNSLKDITIPGSIMSIGEEAFYACADLEEITIPGSVKSIGVYAFSACYQLRELVLGEGVEEISDRAFEECSSLETVSLPNSLKKIGERVFCECRLAYIDIPDDIEAVKENSFDRTVKISYMNKEITTEFLECLKFVRYAVEHNKFLAKKAIIGRSTPPSEVENFYKNADVWRSIQQEYIDRYKDQDCETAVANLYQLCTALGLIHYGLSKEGREVTEFLQKNILTIPPEKLNQQIGPLSSFEAGYNKEFADFFMQNYHEPQFDNRAGTLVPFLWRYNENTEQLENLVNSAYVDWVAKVKKVYPHKTVVAHREAGSENTNLTEKDVVQSLNPKIYKNILEGNGEFAAVCGPYNYSDENFEILQSWWQIAKTIKKEDMILSAAPDQATEGITFELLAKNNPRTAILGELTNCCQKIGDEGSTCVEYGMTKPNSGFVEFTYKGKIIGQSWVWYNEDTQMVCLDNIEAPNRVQETLNKSVELYESFINCLDRLAEAFYISMKVKGYPVKGVSVGKGHTKLNMLGEYYKSFYSKTSKNNFSTPKDYIKSYTDAGNTQYLIADFTKDKQLSDGIDFIKSLE